MDEEVLSVQGRKILTDAQNLGEVHEALAMALIRLDDLPFKAAIENPDRQDVHPRRFMAGHAHERLTAESRPWGGFPRATGE